MSGNHQQAVTVLDTFWNTLNDAEKGGHGRQESGGLSDMDVEASELQMYRALILKECNQVERTLFPPLLCLLSHVCRRQLEDALKCLDQGVVDGVIRDTLGAFEMRCEILLQLGRIPEAEEEARRLLSINTENRQYHQWLCSCRGVDISAAVSGGGSNHSDLIQIYDSLASEFPKSSSVKRIPLDFTTGFVFWCCCCLLAPCMIHP